MTNQRNAIELDEAARRVRLPQGMRIDLGGIGKGWIAQQAAQRRNMQRSASKLV